MAEWMPFNDAPKGGEAFFVADACGEVFEAKYDAAGRVCYRMHSLRCPESYAIIDAEMDGKPVKAKVAIDEPWPELYEHNWVLWTRGFDFAPLYWSPLPDRPAQASSIGATCSKNAVSFTCSADM